MFLDRPNDDWDALLKSKSFSHYIKNKSVFYKLYRTLKGIYLAELFEISDRVVDFENGSWTREPTRNDYHLVLAERVRRYSERLSILVERVRAFGSEPIIVTQARGDYRFENGHILGLVGSRGRAVRGFVDQILGDLDNFSFNGVDHYLILSLFNAASMEVCQQKGAICIDLGNELQFEVGDFYDYVHNTPQGARKIGNFLFKRLRDNPQVTF